MFARAGFCALAVIASAACSPEKTTTATVDTTAAIPDSITSINRGVILSSGALSLHQQEPTAAESGNRIVAAWMGWSVLGCSEIEYTVSNDAGVTWGAPASLPVPSGVECPADPVVAADSAGNFALVSLGDGPHMGVFVYRLAAGATSFGAPVSLDTITYGKHWFDKTQIASTTNGYLVTYSIMGPGGSGIAATSSDGVTWQRHTISMDRPEGIAPCTFGPAATVVYVSGNGTGDWVTSSADGGTTWATPVLVDANGIGLGAQGYGTEPSCVRDSNTVWVAYAVAGYETRLLQLLDGGVTHGAVITLPADGALKAQLGLRNDGSLDLAYYQQLSSQWVFAHSRLSPAASTFGPQEVIRGGLHRPAGAYSQDGLSDYVWVVPAGIFYADNSGVSGRVAFFREP